MLASASHVFLSTCPAGVTAASKPIAAVKSRPRWTMEHRRNLSEAIKASQHARLPEFYLSHVTRKASQTVHVAATAEWVPNTIQPEPGDCSCTLGAHKCSNVHVFRPEADHPGTARMQAKWRDPEYRGKILTALRNPSYQDKRVASQRVRCCLPVLHFLASSPCQAA